MSPDEASRYIAETRAVAAVPPLGGFATGRFDAHGLPIAARARGAQDPADFHYCKHGVSMSAVTREGAPRCPYCRGVTRLIRNGQDTAGPSHLGAANRHVDGRPTLGADCRYCGARNGGASE